MLDHLASDWDHLARACGYATLRLASEEGDIRVIVQNHVVVELSRAQPIPPRSDARAIANDVIATYGQPERAEMRDALGRPTLGDGLVSVVLEYAGEHQVLFTIFADTVWERTVTIRHRDRKWHENRTLLCARERQREAGDAGR